MKGERIAVIVLAVCVALSIVSLILYAVSMFRIVHIVTEVDWDALIKEWGQAHGV